MTTDYTPQLVMQCDTLENLPEIQLPDGYTIRGSQDGDGIHWARIIREAFVDDRFDAAYFAREMVGHPAYAADRILFVCAPDGVPCATASAYRKAGFGSGGYVHYVGVRPDYAGMRLGAAITLAVLHKFKQEGLTSATLQTDDHRLPAIKTYLRLGFTPTIVHENQTARWRAVFAQLGLPWAGAS